MGSVLSSLRAALTSWWGLFTMRLPPTPGTAPGVVPVDRGSREMHRDAGAGDAHPPSVFPDLVRAGAVVPNLQTGMSSEGVEDMLPFLKDKHIRFLAGHLFAELPAQAQAFDLNRMVLLYFAVAGLDLLGFPFTQHQRQSLVDAIYAMQVLPGDAATPDSQQGGFRPGPFIGCGDAGWPSPALHEGDVAHITMTQAALLTLVTLGDDLHRVDRRAVARHIAQCQSKTGCFMNASFGSEQDVRFIYGACVVCELLSDWSGMDVAKAVQFLQACQRYDGGFGESPHAEGHGGTTYCVVASLALLRHLDAIEIPRLVRWVTQRQVRGFAGRPNKLQDTCYTYWLGCTLVLLGALDLVDTVALQKFVLSCQDEQRGGIGKAVGQRPDLLHTFLPIAALGLLGDTLGIAAVDPALGIALRHVRSYSDARAPALRRQVAAQMPIDLLADLFTEVS